MSKVVKTFTDWSGHWGLMGYVHGITNILDLKLLGLDKVMLIPYKVHFFVKHHMICFDKSGTILLITVLPFGISEDIWDILGFMCKLTCLMKWDEKFWTHETFWQILHYPDDYYLTCSLMFLNCCFSGGQLLRSLVMLWLLQYNSFLVHISLFVKQARS